MTGEKRLEILYNYISALRSKIEFSHKLFNEDEDANELDNSKIIETINKNLDNLTKNNEDFLDVNNLTVDVSMDSSNNTTSHTKSVEFYIKKRIGNNMSSSMSVPNPINSNI